MKTVARAALSALMAPVYFCSLFPLVGGVFILLERKLDKTIRELEKA
jgi:hypothetical protein